MQNGFYHLLGVDLLTVAKTEIIQPLMRDSRTELIGDEFHLTIRPHGIAFVADFDGRVSTIFFYSEGMNDYRQFSGELPERLGFGDSRNFVHQRLGQPSANGGGKVIQFFGKAPKWDRYDHEGFSLHIQYLDNETSISLVSLMRPDSVPR